MTDTAETAAKAPETAPAATEPATPPQDTPGTVEAPDSPEAVEDSSDDPEPRSREAARYRRKLRELEGEVAAEREQWAEERGLMRARLDHMQQGEAERIAAEHLADPADLWRDGLDLDQLRDEHGDIDPGKVTTAVNELTAKHPHWKRPTPSFSLNGQRSGATGQHTPRHVGWRAALTEAD